MQVDRLPPTLFGFAAALALTACVAAPPSAGMSDTGDTGGMGDTGDMGDSANESSTDTGEAELYTWYRDVQPIVAQKCGTCHVDGDIAPFALTTYEQTASFAPILAPSIAAGDMPPWPPAAGCAEYRHSLELSEEQREILLTWIDQGAPEGDPSEAPPAPEPEPEWEPDLLLAMPQPYTPTRSPDDYRCFLIDGPELATTHYVTGFEVYPGERSMVHHVIAYLVLPGAIETFQAFDDAEDGPGYTCFGGPTAGGGFASITSVRWIGSWAPGGGHWTAPAGTGMAVPPGSKVVIQMHYNSTPGSTLADRSAVGLQLADSVESPAVMMPFTSASWVSGAMHIPAGDDSVIHVHNANRSDQIVQFALAGIGASPGDTVYIRDASLHMHMLGRQAQVSVQRASGDHSCLLWIDDWDFNWQGSYALREPAVFGPNDELRLACEWDNSAANQQIVDGEPREPINTNWGDGTFDEMCLAILYAHK